ncbi:Carboxylesterase [Candidatus Burkholderia pumila]|uniref:Carboxylesterase n=1 Tax=Candidatus Burkholderia pumila TaxID=1090375 RepID=A0ABR5HKN3_9BURK|nr:Carboxylesterase [Candidatus Burkholderia pumila]
MPRPPLTIESGPSPEIIVLFIHGLGTEGAHYAPLMNLLAQGFSRPIRFLLSTTPLRSVTIYANQRLSAWFDLPDIRFTLHEDVAALRNAQAYLTNLVKAEIRRGTAPERIVIGFSQGAALSLLTGLSFLQRLGASPSSPDGC